MVSLRKWQSPLWWKTPQAFENELIGDNVVCRNIKTGYSTNPASPDRHCCAATSKAPS